VNEPRRRAREAALQILYFWEVGRAQPLSAVEAYFAEHQPEAGEAVVRFATELAFGTIGDLEVIDQTIARHAHRWRVDRLAVIDRLVLRLAVWELRHSTETPPAVVINEALELARRFSSEDAVRFVNGVLDAVRRELEAGASGADDPATE
jgi:N utilization substance protein B